MYCSKCGAGVEDDALFCSVCGTKIVHPELVEEVEKMQDGQAAPIPQSEYPVPAVESNKGKRTKWLIAAGIAVVILVIFLIVKMTSSQGYLGKMPYDVKFGESYEQILEKDPEAGEPKWNDVQDISTHGALDGTFFGMGKNDLSVYVYYALGTDNSLCGITEVIQMKEDSSISEGELFEALQERMTKALGEPKTTTLGMEWKNSDGITFELQLWMDDIIFLAISPA